MAYGCGLGALVGALTLAMPFRLRNYRLPDPAALRVARDGLHVHVVAKQGRRVRTYIYLPWHDLGTLTLTSAAQAGVTRPALRIELTDVGQGVVAAGGSADARRLVGGGGTLTVPDVGTADLVEAVARYSDGRHRVVERHDPAQAVPRFDVVLYGYDIGQVDALVRRIWAAMSPGGAASRPAIRDELAAGPALPKGPHGYERTQVDDFLRRMTSQLDQHDAA